MPKSIINKTKNSMASLRLSVSIGHYFSKLLLLQNTYTDYNMHT
jgi:hypothetical protein